MKQKVLIFSIFLLASIILLPMSVFAHVVVKPAEVGIASRQLFTASVPNEKDIPVVGLRILIPTGVDSVSPNVKTGWKIDVQKQGDIVTEINWSGGNIPVGQRDDFTFGAKVPAAATNLIWKAYQTYQDGTVVSWDMDPSQQLMGDDDSSNSGPYSQTKVINDLSSPTATLSKDIETEDNNWPLILSFTACLISITSLGINLRKK